MLRIKGQEVVVSILRNGATVGQLTQAVKDLNIEFEMDLLQQGYIGQTADQMDDVYKAAGGDISLHTGDPATFDFITFLVDRAAKRVPMQQVNIKATFNFPNGSRRLVTMTDVFFGSLPIGVGGRTEYVEQKLTFKCSSAPIRAS